MRFGMPNIRAIAGRVDTLFVGSLVAQQSAICTPPTRLSSGVGGAMTCQTTSLHRGASETACSSRLALGSPIEERMAFEASASVCAAWGGYSGAAAPPVMT